MYKTLKFQKIFSSVNMIIAIADYRYFSYIYYFIIIIVNLYNFLSTDYFKYLGHNNNTFPRLLLLLCVDRLLLKKLCLTSFPDSSFLVALNCAVANSSARALFGMVPFWTSWLFRPKNIKI